MAEKKERRGLGRGLSALMADVETQAPGQADASQRSDQLTPIENIVPNPDQPRRRFDPEQLEDLANSIAAKGVLQPLIVRPKPNDPGMYEIVAGERRWRAAQMAQLHELPVLVRDFNDTEVLEIAIIENVQRADLNPIEEASGYRQLMFKFGHTQEQLAEALGKSRSHIANVLRLLNLPEAVQTHVVSGAISSGHARALITAGDPEALAKQVISRGLSVRDTEKLVKSTTPTDAPRKTPPGAFPVEKDADTKALEGDLSAALGMKVSINHHAQRENGNVTISYDTLEQLDALCMILSTAR